jgi:hypothetical protein
MPIFTVGCAAVCAKIYEVGNIKKEAAADVPVIVRRGVVVDVEQTIVGVVAIVTTDVEARVRRAEVPVIARGLRTKKHRQCTDSPI